MTPKEKNLERFTNLRVILAPKNCSSSVLTLSNQIACSSKFVPNSFQIRSKLDFHIWKIDCVLFTGFRHVGFL